MSDKVAVVAIGGNSLIKDEAHKTVEDQYAAAGETCEHIVTMIEQGWTVAIGHGNGPQVGFIHRRSELARHELHEVPLEVCGADTQGAIGYALQQNLYNALQRRNIDKPVITVVTQVEVSSDDPAFEHPSKPIGSFMDEATARQRQTEGWNMMEDAGRGWRRVVPSPLPKRIVEEPVIRQLISNGVIVIAAGGGGIPVVADEQGKLRGIAAVIDKDYAASLLASSIGANLFIISTAVEKVALNFGQSNQTWLDHLTLAQAKSYLTEKDHFARGSMAPKIQAVINYLERGGQRAIITNPENLERALACETGTHITHGLEAFLRFPVIIRK
ncbi:MAG: carbamate kinase [Anaerolineae bacterium]|nr:carbamate kinase [Anaerolineae bacterium]